MCLCVRVWLLLLGFFGGFGGVCFLFLFFILGEDKLRLIGVCVGWGEGV